MFIVGFDLGKRKSQICVEDSDGNVVAEVRINTTAEEITSALAKFPGAHVLIEASTSADWVARVLEGIGCEVVVADPRFSLMYAQTNKKIKNDRRDARALADALRLKAFRRAHRKSEAARRLHGRLSIRRTLIGLRTRLINHVRALCEREGVIVARCHHSGEFLEAIEGTQMEPWLFEVIAPALAQIGSLSEQLAVLDKELKATSDSDPVARNLQTARGIGPITSLAFISVVDDPHRFESARQLSSYLGLVPGEHNSAESRRPPGAITKTGDPMLRGYLFEAAFSLMTRRAPETPLKSWSAALVKRSGGKKKKAAVGVARRLARILWAMWRDNKPFDAARTAPLNANAPASKAA